jgi:MFS family permease
MLYANIIYMRPGLRFLLLSNYLNVFGFALFSPFYALFALRVGAGAFQIGIAWSIYMAVAGSLIIIIGRAEDRLPDKRKMVVSGYFWLSIGALLFLLVKSPTSLFLVLAINAVGPGILMPAWKSTYAHLEDRGKEASEWSFFDGGNMLCIALAALVGGYLVKEHGFRVIFVMMFIIQLIAALVSLKLLSANAARAEAHV